MIFEVLERDIKVTFPMSEVSYFMERSSLDFSIVLRGGDKSIYVSNEETISKFKEAFGEFHAGVVTRSGLRRNHVLD